MANIDERARVIPVYYRRGFFETWDDSATTKDPKFSRAPFDIVQIERAESGAVDRFIVPTSYPCVGNPTLWGDTFQTDHEFEGFGFVSEKMEVINEYEIGDMSNENNRPWNMFELHYV